VKSDAFRQAVEAEDLSTLDELFTDDVVFRSPAVFQPYEGKEALGTVLSAVVQVFEDFRYTDQIETDDTAALLFEARVGDREVSGVDVLRFDSEGKARELMVMIRPLSGLNALVEAMGEKLAAMGVPVPGR
jgi:hypothetical protein